MKKLTTRESLVKVVEVCIILSDHINDMEERLSKLETQNK